MKNIFTITTGEVITIHEILIDEFGGSHGLRDFGLLESSVNRIYQTFEGKELYKSAVEKSAAIFESLINNHPFVDGNKRIAYVMMRSLLLSNKLDINTSENEKYSFVISAASGEINFDGIKKWIEDNLIHIE